MSWRASRLSNPIEALIASMIASGPAANRPPHIVLEPVLVIASRLSEGNHVVRMLLASVLYLALSAGANAQDMSDLLTGEMRGLVVHDAPQAASELPFLRVDGTEGSLADYEGRHVVLNFWATWCAPCREEMPSLQTLHDTLGGEDFAVVTLATGFNQPQAIRRFFEETGVTDLPSTATSTSRSRARWGCSACPSR
jgi:thiol-disulfide isomerase/thioredoxin